MLKVALTHDALEFMDEAAQTLLALHELLPLAPIYTAKYTSRLLEERFKQAAMRPIRRWRFAGNGQSLFGVMLSVASFESLDLREFDLVISSSSGLAKGIVTRPDALHISYCHTPLKAAWEDPVPGRELRRLALPWLRTWDVTTAARVDYFVSPTSSMAARIAKIYRREAIVIPPPVEVHSMSLAAEGGSYYLVLASPAMGSELETAVRELSRTNLPLRLAGSGAESSRVRALAGKNINVLGSLSPSGMRAQVAGCQTLVVPGVTEGCAPIVEAMAAGKPVIAYAGGAAPDLIEDGVTGRLYHEQTPPALREAFALLSEDTYEPTVIRQHAEEFSAERFKQRFLQFIETRLRAHPILSRKVDLGPSPLDTLTAFSKGDVSQQVEST